MSLYNQLADAEFNFQQCSFSQNCIFCILFASTSYKHPFILISSFLLNIPRFIRVLSKVVDPKKRLLPVVFHCF